MSTQASASPAPDVASPAPSSASSAPVSAGTASNQFECAICHRDFKSQLALNGHMKTHDKEARLKELERKKNRTDADIWADIKMQGAEAMEDLLRVRLEDDLNGPGVPVESAEKALREWDNDSSLRGDMSALYTMLCEDAGIKKDKAFRIVQKLTGVYNKYAQALQAGGHYFPFQASMGQSGQTQSMFGGPQFQNAPMMIGGNAGMGSPMGPQNMPLFGMVITGYDMYGRPIYGYPGQFGFPGQTGFPGSQPREGLTEEKVTKIVDTKFSEIKALIEKGNEKKEMPVEPRRSKVKFEDGAEIEVDANMAQSLALAKIMTGKAGKTEVEPGEDSANVRLVRDLESKLETEKEARRKAELDSVRNEFSGKIAAKEELDKEREANRREVRSITDSALDKVERASKNAGEMSTLRLVDHTLDRGFAVAERLTDGQLKKFAVEYFMGNRQQDNISPTTASPEVIELEKSGYVVNE